MGEGCWHRSSGEGLLLGAERLSFSASWESGSGAALVAGRALRSVKEVCKLKAVVADSQGPFHLRNKYFATRRTSLQKSLGLEFGNRVSIAAWLLFGVHLGKPCVSSPAAIAK